MSVTVDVCDIITGNMIIGEIILIAELHWQVVHCDNAKCSLVWEGLFLCAKSDSRAFMG